MKVDLTSEDPLHQINNIPTAASSHDQRPPLNIPLPDLLLGSREDYSQICVPLYNAAMSDNLKDVKMILNNRTELVRYCITENYETVLHIAVLGTSYLVLEYLLSFMETKDLALQNANGQTALCLAAIKGVVKIAKLLVNSNNTLLDIPTSQGTMPLYLTAFFGKHDMVKYLFSVQNINSGVWTHEDRGCFFLKCIEADQFGIALQIVENDPEVATAIDGKVIRVLARKPKVFKKYKPSTPHEFLISRLFRLKLNIPAASQELESQKLLRIIWTNIMKLPKAKVDEIIRGPADPLIHHHVPPKYSSHVLFLATEMGNTAFVADLIRRYPHIVSEVNDNNQTIFHVAVLHRHMGVYMLLHEIGTLKDSIITLEDKNGNNMLHLVGMMLDEERREHIIPHEMRAVTLRIQRELLWFQEVKATLPPCFQERKNIEGLTPREVFTRNSRHILSKDKEWLKGTVEQLMVVGALTGSVTFAASITFAGGYNQNTGSPMLSSKLLFVLFLLSTAFSFAYSCLAILIGLSILTFNITEEDFLKTIPQKLIGATSSTFTSVASLLFAISINFMLLYQNKSKAIPTLAVVILYVPLGWLVMDVAPFLAYTSLSLDHHGFIFDHNKRILYKPNTRPIYYLHRLSSFMISFMRGKDVLYNFSTNSNLAGYI